MVKEKNMDGFNPKVDFYFKKSNWQKEIDQLRLYALDCGLEEALKWGTPCYMFDKRNVVLIHEFKTYCALLFFKGALMNDPGKLLIQQTKNVQAARQMRFTDVRHILDNAAIIKSYIKQAMDIESAGLEVVLKKTSEFTMPSEFKSALESKPALNKAFYALTPGRQRGYLLYFDAAKQSTTRESRIQKCIPKIMSGVGLND